MGLIGNGTDTVRLQRCKVNSSVRSVLSFCLSNSSYSIFTKDRMSGARGRGVFQAIKCDLLSSLQPKIDYECKCI